MDGEIRRLIRTMAQDGWGAPRIHAELTKLGFIVSEMTVSRYLFFDRDSIFSAAVVEFIKSMGTSPVRTSFRSPWQNGTAERWIGSCRREMLEHVVVLSERHLVRLARSYIDYYHEDLCHLGLDKDSPNERPVTPRPSPSTKVVALARLGGLHHRYEWREAA